MEIPENADANVSNQNGLFSSILFESLLPNKNVNNFEPCNVYSAWRNFSIFSLAGRLAKMEKAQCQVFFVILKNQFYLQCMFLRFHQYFLDNHLDDHRK